jgi:thiosulfate reductase cytochrome b subunit
MTTETMPENVIVAASPTVARPLPKKSTRLVYRHSLPIRLMHWINVIALSLMFFSGLQIFNAHPSLSWGNYNNPNKPLLALDAREDASGKLVGVTRIGNREFITTGVLGVSNGPDGTPVARGFPSWLTVPGPGWLSMARMWHFFFAWVFVLNGICYITYSLVRKHVQHDMWPTRADWRGIGKSIADHVRFKHPHGEEALRYNILQRLAYLIVIFVFGIGIVLMGLMLSPRMDSIMKPLVEFVGGRQAARTIHFIIAWSFVAFVLIHVFEVLISGVFNQLRGMITGYYKVETDPPEPTDSAAVAVVPMVLAKETSHD